MRQQYQAGTAQNIERTAYWDSLRVKAHYCTYPFYEYKALEKIAGIYGTRNDMPKAIVYTNRMLAIAEVQGYKTDMIPLLKKLVNLSSMQYDRKQSLYFIYRGLKMAEELRDKKSLAYFYSCLGLYYYTSGEHEKALQIYFRCLRLCQAIGYDFGICSALLDIGTVYGVNKKYREAIPYYLESKKYLNELDGTIYAVQIYNSISSAYIMQQKLDSAYYYSSKAVKLAKQIDSKVAIASSLEMLASADYNGGNIKAAERHGLEALNAAEAANFVAQLPSLLNLLKDIYKKGGKHKAALNVYERSVNLRDSFSNESIRKQAIEKEYAYMLEKKENAYTLLSQQSQIQRLKIVQQRYLVGGMVVLVLVILITTTLTIRHNRFRAEHQRVQLEQKLLRMQMNPHFLFNSMNSIQQLIMSGKNQPAELYLSKFSKLVRALLESNMKEGLTIQEETDMLEAYLGMESLRFSNNFSYSIEVDRQIRTDLVNIPHLMIQPFVENAIWHGLQTKDDDRRLQIRIGYHTEHTIKCIVDDNGIGRAASTKSTGGPHKRSLALDLVQQRIDLIRKTYKITGNIQITDKKDDRGNSLGTTVALILPILN